MTEANQTEADLFEAAVSYSLWKGKLKTKSAADLERSRLTGKTFVLAAADGRVIDRVPLDVVRKEAARLRRLSHDLAVRKKAIQLEKNAPKPSDLKSDQIVRALCLVGVIGVALYACHGISNVPPSDWLTDGSAWASCEVALKDRLRDPDSYQQVGDPVGGPTDDGRAVWTWRFRARNGFGGMNLGLASCVAKRAGQTVETAVSMD